MVCLILQIVYNFMTLKFKLLLLMMIKPLPISTISAVTLFRRLFEPGVLVTSSSVSNSAVEVAIECWALIFPWVLVRVFRVLLTSVTLSPVELLYFLFPISVGFKKLKLKYNYKIYGFYYSRKTRLLPRKLLYTVCCIWYVPLSWLTEILVLIPYRGSSSGTMC